MMNPKEGDVIAVWFSCGAASAVAAKKTIEKYGNFCTVRVINNPVAEEDEDNRRFLADCEKWLGVKIELATNSKFPDASCVTVWEKRRFMAGQEGAPCTYELKKKARQEWENSNHHDWIVLGYPLEEKKRYERFALTERDNALAILIDAGISKDDCFRIIQEAGIELPRLYKMGYPNANCIGCVKASSPEYWNHVRNNHPEQFKQRAVQSRELGARLVRVKNKRLFLDELDPLAKGRKLKSMPDCGIFCEATPPKEK